MMYKSSWELIFRQIFVPNGFLVLCTILTVWTEPLACIQIETHATLFPLSRWLAAWIAGTCAQRRDDDDEDVTQHCGQTLANTKAHLWVRHERRRAEKSGGKESGEETHYNPSKCQIWKSSVQWIWYKYLVVSGHSFFLGTGTAPSISKLFHFPLYIYLRC